jgi:diguanylate cyclase (GGDEF)-like protein/PAS domain S-box-containing protein
MRARARKNHGRARPVEPVATDSALMTAIVDSGTFSMITVDLDGTIVQWNRGAERLFGWRASEAVGRSIEIIVPIDRRDELGAMVAALRRGDHVASIETVRRTKDGDDLQVYLQVSPVIDDSGELVGASKFVFDCTEQTSALAALAESEARYRALVDALTEFVLVTNADGAVARPQSSWSAYTGQDEHATAGRGWLDAVHPHDRPGFESRWAEGTAVVEPFSVSGRVLHHDGEYRQCEGRVAPMRDRMGRVVEWIAAFADTHERHVAQARERNTADRFRKIFAANVFGVCYGEQRNILDANDVMLEMLGIRRRDLSAGVAIEDLIVRDGIDRSAPLGNGEGTEFQIRRPDGSIAYLLTAGVSLAPDRGWLAVAVDVTQRKAAEQETEHRALHDPLTGLPNRRLLVDRLEHGLSRSRRQQAPIAVLFCDLDRFKEVNDVFGHSVGDLALQTVARRLEELMRESDTVARTGGDEFVVILEDLASPDDATQIAERIRVGLSMPLVVEGHDLEVTCSIGVAISDDADERVEGLLRRADDAMYRAKDLGRDRVACTSASRDSRTDRRWIERELKRALVDDSLELAFQPVIDLREQRPIGAEALLRWRVDGEAIPTGNAIAVAEESGFIVQLSDWVLRSACRQFSTWRRGHPEAAHWKLHINVSTRDVADERFVDRVLDAITEGGCVPTDVCLEMTETTMLRNPERAHARLSALREKGMVIAIDDFGAGYASLGVLRDVPADIVKIDRSLVADLTSSERDRAIVRHAIDLAHGLDLVVVGEGVETEAQMTILSELGCDHGQGYAFAYPLPVEDLTSSLP